MSDAVIEIQNPTNACIALKSENEKLLSDPWLNDGIYFGTWHNFPRPDDALKAETLSNVDYCLITHIHKDHFNIETIKRLDPSTQFLVPNVFGWQVIQKVLNVNGFENVTVLECEKDVFETKDFEITAIPPLNVSGLSTEDDDFDENKMNIDGGFSIVSKDSGLKLVFLADDNLYSQEAVASCLSILQEPDLIAFAYSGFATDFPFKYDFSDQEKIDIVLANEKTRFDKQVENLGLIKPKFVLPYSSEFVPVGPHTESWIETYKEIWTSSKVEVAKRYGEALCVESDTLYPTEKLVFKGRERQEIEKKVDRGTLYDQMKAYWSGFANDNPTSVPSDDEVETLRSTLPEAASSYYDSIERFKLNPRQTVSVSVGSHFIGALGPKGMVANEDDIEGDLLTVSGNVDMISDLLNGDMHWNDAILSMRLDWSRTPNTFCPDTIGALNYLRRARKIT